MYVHHFPTIMFSVHNLWNNYLLILYHSICIFILSLSLSLSPLSLVLSLLSPPSPSPLWHLIALVDCKANVLDDVISVSCPGIDGLPEEDNYQCSVDFAPPESCENQNICIDERGNLLFLSTLVGTCLCSYYNV